MLFHPKSALRTEQTAGDIEVIQTEKEARELLRHLEGLSGPFGLDTETVGVDPTEESPVGRGRVVCWSLAWTDTTLGTHRRSGTPLARRAFLWARDLPTFGAWLSDPTIPKVGHNIWAFDKHVLRNTGVELNGIVCDTLRLGRLLNSSGEAEHGLKGRMESSFGYKLASFRETFSRRVCLGEEDHGEPTYRQRTVDGRKLKTLCGGLYSRVGAGTEIIDLESIPTQYPDRLAQLYDYASLDAKGTLELYYLLRGYAERADWTGLGGQHWGNIWQFYERFWNPFLSLLWDIERAGIAYDPTRTADGAAAARESTERLLESVRAWVADPEFNPASPPQLTKFLYTTLGLPVPPVEGSRTALKKVPPGKLPTSEASLTWLKANGHGSDGLDTLQLWKKEARQLQFLEKLPNHLRGDRIHTVLQPETATGRLTSKDPNLQQIPKRYDPYRIRSGFIAPAGHRLVVADFSQLEMRVLAHFLVQLFDDWTLADDLATGDAHTETARRLGLSRDVAKEINYGINYGKSDLGLSLSLGVPQARAREYLEAHARAYPGIRRFQEHCFAEAKRTGVVRTLLGRTRALPAARSDLQWERGKAFRQAANTPIQGSAADIVVAAMLKLQAALTGGRGRIVLQVHDELLVECAEEHATTVLELVRSTMEHPFKEGFLRVPLTVDAKIATNWLDGH